MCQETTEFWDSSSGSPGDHADPAPVLSVLFAVTRNFVRQRSWGWDRRWRFFDGYGAITSDAGGLLLREVEAKTGILRRFAACFTDFRNPDLAEHTAYELIAQRVFALALGYEDLNDHDTLRYDPLLAVLVGKLDPTGQGRRRERDRGKALAGKSTLNRLELTPVGADEQSRYKKIATRRSLQEDRSPA